MLPLSCHLCRKLYFVLISSEWVNVECEGVCVHACELCKRVCEQASERLCNWCLCWNLYIQSMVEIRDCIYSEHMTRRFSCSFDDHIQTPHKQFQRLLYVPKHVPLAHEWQLHVKYTSGYFLSQWDSMTITTPVVSASTWFKTCTSDTKCELAVGHRQIKVKAFYIAPALHWDQSYLLQGT